MRRVARRPPTTGSVALAWALALGAVLVSGRGVTAPELEGVATIRHVDVSSGCWGLLP